MNNENTSPEASLRSGLSELGYDVSAESKGSEAVSTTETTRGESQSEGSESNQTNKTNAEASTNTEADAQTNNTETAASVSDSSVNGESTDGQPTNQTDKSKKNRGSPRIQELANANRTLTEKIAALEAKISQQQVVQPKAEAVTPEKPKEHVPKPTAPKYDRAELQKVTQQLAMKIRSNQATEQEIGIYDAAMNELDAWRQYDIDERLWKIENGQAAKEKDGYKAYYQQEALKKYPSLQDPNSEHSKLYTSTRNRLDQIAKNLDVEGDYWAAMVSDLVLGKKKYESETGALKKEIEKLRKELDSAKGKLEPVEESNEEASVSNSGKKADETPEQEFRRKMAAARRNLRIVA